MLALLLGLAAAQSPPCEDFTRPDHLEGEHFWIEWDPEVGDAELAQENLDWAEQARRAYIEDLGYDFTDRIILIELEQAPSSGGLTTTVQCTEGDIVPHITLFSTSPGFPGANTTMHEVVHAVQYAYMGSYVDAITSWPWWMEGHATWMTWHADHDRWEQTGPAKNYLDNPWLGLHQGPTAYVDPVASRFLYGTVLIFLQLERDHGHEAVRATWEYGAQHTGDPIYLPDAIEAVGVDFHQFWLDHMAEMTVLDNPEADFYFDGMKVEEHVKFLPASGTPKKPRRPAGLGLSGVHFKKSTGASGGALEVRFSGDPDVEWMAALVRTRGSDPGGKINEIVELEVGADGTGTATLADFDGSRDGWLVVSPMGMSLEGHDYSWEAGLVLPGGGEEKGGCGCASSPWSTGWLWLLPVFALRRSEPRGPRR